MGKDKTDFKVQKTFVLIFMGINRIELLKVSLDLETSRSTTTTGTLELATLRHNSRSLVLMRTHAEVSNGFTGVSRTTNNQSVLASRSSAGKLVESDNFTTSLQDTGFSSLSNLECSNSDLGNFVKTSIVGNSTSNNNDLTSVILGLSDTGDTGDGNRRSVDLRKEKRSENDLVELGVGTTSKESVNLDQQLQVDIVGLGSRAVTASNVLLSSAVDTHGDVLCRTSMVARNEELGKIQKFKFFRTRNFVQKENLCCSSNFAGG